MKSPCGATIFAVPLVEQGHGNTMLDNNLIDGLYEAAIVPERWPQVLARIAAAAGAVDALLSVVSPIGHGRWVTSTPAFEDMVLAHLEYFPNNERTRRLLATRHAGFVVDSDVLTEAEMAAEPVYREYLWPRGFGYGVATAIHAPTGDATVIHAEGLRAAGPIARDAVARLDALRPHLARAALLANRLELERARSAAAALDVVGLPAAILGRGGRTLAANARMVLLMPAAVQDLPSRLRLVDGAADALLAGAFAALDQPRHDAAVRSIPVAAREQTPPIVFHLTPIKGAAHDVFAQARAILVATPITPGAAPDAGLVQGLFDLTPAEAKLASLVAAGHRPREAAVALGWTEGTARTTLKQVFAKTGVNRQVDLVTLLRGGILR